jgi:uncharacterized protein YoaH (UPF0181 family)
VIDKSKLPAGPTDPDLDEELAVLGRDTSEPAKSKSDPGLDSIKRQSFQSLKVHPHDSAIKAKRFMDSETIKELMQQGMVTREEFVAMLLEVGSSADGLLSFPQFSKLFDLLQEHVDERSDQTESPQEEMTPELLRASRKRVFDELKSRGRPGDVVEVNDFLSSKEIATVMAEGDLTRERVLQFIADVGCAPETGLTFSQFEQVVEKIDEFLAGVLSQQISQPAGETPPSAAPTLSPTRISSGSDELNERPGSEIDPRELRKARLDFFEELKMREVATGLQLPRQHSRTVRVCDLREAEDVDEVIRAGKLTQKEFDEIIQRIGSAATGKLTTDQFLRFFDEVDLILEKRLEMKSSFDVENDSTREKERKMLKEMLVEKDKEDLREENSGDGEGDFDGMEDHPMMSQADWDKEVLTLVRPLV